MTRLTFYRRLSIVSGLVLVLLNHFAFGFLSFFVPDVKADAVSWVGPASGDWDDPENWSSGELPTSNDNVLIASTTALTVTVPLGTTIDFAHLTIDGSVIVTSSSIAQTAVYLVGDIGVGGNITLTGTNNSSTTHLANSPSGRSGVLRQYNTNTQTISGDLLVESGGFLWTSFNHEEHVYEIDFVAENIDIQFGGRVSAAGTGYTNGTLVDRDGEGPGGGVYGTGPNSSGASHAGNGGTDTQGDNSGVGYCNFEDPSSIGSGGAASQVGISPAGGGQVRLFANSELTIDGQIYAYGPSKAVGAGGSGGGGGSITLSGQDILGTPQFIDAFGGHGRGNTSTAQMSGGGGGG
nr:hypothetical protein [Candidatus Magasanikbacteria bacterium]